MESLQLLEEEGATHPRTVAEMESSRQKSRYTDILPCEGNVTLFHYFTSFFKF